MLQPVSLQSLSEEGHLISTSEYLWWQMIDTNDWKDPLTPPSQTRRLDHDAVAQAELKAKSATEKPSRP